MEQKILNYFDGKDLEMLRKQSIPITVIGKMENLFKEMKEYLKSHEDELSISAPQLGFNVSAFAVARRTGDVQIIINPKVLRTYEHKKSFYYETCASIPNYRCLVMRNRKIKVSYQNEDGLIIKETLKDKDAVTFQHEFDHLYGILTIDKNLN